MIVYVGDVPVHLAEDGDRICIGIRNGKTFEKESLAIWATLCAKGGTVLDIGAYTGLYGIAAAKLGCTVYAFEPHPQNAARLVENAARNGVNITLVREAVGAEIGRATFHYNPRVPFTSGGSIVTVSKGSRTVNVTTIDALGIKDVRAMKLDIERGEPAALWGAAETIARDKPAILLEVLDDERKAGVTDALPGYRVAREIDNRNWLMMPC